MGRALQGLYISTVLYACCQHNISLYQVQCHADTQLHCRRTLFGVTSIFVNLSETMAEFGFLVSFAPETNCYETACVLLNFLSAQAP